MRSKPPFFIRVTGGVLELSYLTMDVVFKSFWHAQLSFFSVLITNMVIFYINKQSISSNLREGHVNFHCSIELHSLD